GEQGMRTTLTLKHVEENDILKQHFDQRIDKVRQHLKRYSDDLTFLHGVIEKNPHKDECFAALSLYLPTVVLHCREKGIDSLAAMNSSFLALTRQIEKHKAKLTREKRRKER
ncbi:MAG: HPF/RaiA family ribosome-associated protein, partial [Candidatus Omnitrophota bacterium]